MSPGWKKIAFSSLCLSVLSSPALYAQTAVPADPLRPFERTFRFTATGSETLVHLDSALVVLDTIIVQNEKGIIRAGEYYYDVQTGSVIFRIPPEKGAQVTVIGRVSPFPPQKTYRKRTRTFLSEDSAVTEKIRPSLLSVPETHAVESSQLFKSGSLTRSFSFGTNRGLELKSGLNMQIKGRLGSQYEMNAVLTDRNSPIQPEGNTRTLNEIDKIFIDISGPGVSTRFGDIYMNNDKTEFGRFSRKLTGATLTSSLAGNTVSVSAATTEGKYQSLKLQGIEGNQGPYLLTGIDGERNIIVLAGTEKVYIDGTRVIRGEDYDYIIDYASAQVTFTRNRLITSDSRITVDFQYSDGNFKKSFYSVQLAHERRTSGFFYSASLTRESDNKDKPLTGTFSAEDLSNLGKAGDDPNRAFQSTARYVGEGQGTYRKIVVDTLEQFTYEDSADYRVFFSDVGQGRGDYIQERVGVYRYIGRNEGRYLPVRKLPLPRAHSLADMTFGYSDNNNRFSLSTEYAYSLLDKNIFSRVNDKDNGGSALSLEFSLSPARLSLNGKGMGTASLTAKLRRTGTQFQPIDRTTEVEFDRKWDLESQAVSGQQIVELQGEYKPHPLISVKPSFGSLSERNGLSSNRQALRLGFDNHTSSRLSYFVENISRRKSGVQTNWLRQQGSSSFHLKGFTPSVIFESELKKDNQAQKNGYAFHDIGGKLQYDYKKSFMAYTMFQVRRDKNFLSGGLQPLSRAENRIFHMEFRNGRRISARIHLVNRKKEYSAQQPDIGTNLADIRIQSSEMRGALTTRFNAQVTSERLPQKDVAYFRVDEGKGAFSFDEKAGEYIPDENGNFEKRILTTDNLQAVKREKIGLTFRYDPSQYRRQDSHRLLNEIRTSTLIRYENSRRDGRETPFSPSTAHAPLFRFITLNQDVFLFEKHEKFNLRLRQSYSTTDDNRYAARNENREMFEFSIRLRSRVSTATTLESNLWYLRARKSLNALSTVNNNISTRKADLQITRRTGRTARVFVKAAGARQSEESYSDTEVRYISLKPGLEKAFLGSGRLTSSFQWFWVATNHGRYLPYDFAEGNQPGSNYTWSAAFDYKTSQNLITSIKYHGSRKTRNDRILHNLRAELQVLF